MLVKSADVEGRILNGSGRVGEASMCEDPRWVRRAEGGRAVFSFLVIENFVAIENVDSKLPVILQLVSPNLCIPSVS